MSVCCPILAAGFTWEAFGAAHVGWLIGLGLMLSTSLGFVAGRLSARPSDERVRRRLLQSVEGLLHGLHESLDRSADYCSRLAQLTAPALRPETLTLLEDKRQTLFAGLGTLLQQHAPRLPEAPPPPPPTLEWSTEPADSGTGLPGRTAFDTNLKRLVEWNLATGESAALVLIRMDRFGNLRDRFGRTGSEGLARRLTQLVCLHLADRDCAARITEDTWGVLVVGVDGGEGETRTSLLRNEIRGHRFLLEDNETEVLVTASLGVTTFGPGEGAELVLNRGQTALRKAERMGRNQWATAGAV